MLQCGLLKNILNGRNLKMRWIKNTKKEKPKLDEKYKDEGYSVNVLIHLKCGLTFIGYWDYKQNIWSADTMKINDDEVLFWLNIPKLPSLA